MRFKAVIVATYLGISLKKDMRTTSVFLGNLFFFSFFRTTACDANKLQHLDNFCYDRFFSYSFTPFLFGLTFSCGRYISPTERVPIPLLRLLSAVPTSPFSLDSAC